MPCRVRRRPVEACPLRPPQAYRCASLGYLSTAGPAANNLASATLRRDFSGDSMKVLRTTTLGALALAVTASAAASQTLDLKQYRLLDLTHPLNAKTLYWPTSPTTFKLDSLSYGKTPGGWFYSSFAFSAPEHGGTHLDAPIHFGEGHLSVDRVPLDRLIAPAVVIDVTAKTKS